VREERGVEDGGTALESLRGEAIVHVVRCAEAERAVVVIVAVPVEEGATVGAGVLDVHETLGETGPYLSVLKADSEGRRAVSKTRLVLRAPFRRTIHPSVPPGPKCPCGTGYRTVVPVSTVVRYQVGVRGLVLVGYSQGVARPSGEVWV
jgi:hypothetical protein